MEVRSSGDGYELIIFVEPVGEPGAHEILALVAWKGNASFPGPTQYAVGIGPPGFRLQHPVTRWAFRMLSSLVMLAVRLVNTASVWKNRLDHRMHKREAWPEIEHREALSQVRVDRRNVDILAGHTLVLLVDEHDPATGHVTALIEHSVTPRLQMVLPTKEDLRQFDEAMKSPDEAIRQAATTNFTARFGDGADTWRQTLGADPVYRGFMTRAAK